MSIRGQVAVVTGAGSAEGIDVLVNNAGLAQAFRPVEDTTLQQSSYAAWQRQIAITLHTAFRARCCPGWSAGSTAGS